MFLEHEGAENEIRYIYQSADLQSHVMITDKICSVTLKMA